MRVGVPTERTPGERRVALVPDAVRKLRGRGLEVAVEPGAGEAAAHLDEAYREAGASLDAAAAWSADAVAKVRGPLPGELDRLRPGAVLVGFLDPLMDASAARGLPGPASARSRWRPCRVSRGRRRWTRCPRRRAWPVTAPR